MEARVGWGGAGSKDGAPLVAERGEDAEDGRGLVDLGAVHEDAQQAVPGRAGRHRHAVVPRLRGRREQRRRRLQRCGRRVKRAEADRDIEARPAEAVDQSDQDSLPLARGGAGLHAETGRRVAWCGGRASSSDEDSDGGSRGADAAPAGGGRAGQVEILAILSGLGLRDLVITGWACSHLVVLPIGIV